MISTSVQRTACTIAAGLTFVVGVVGMAASFLLMLVVGGVEILACAAGFVAGSILAAGGLVSASVLVARPGRDDAKAPDASDFR